jgi:hypothetical protein
MQWVSNKCGGNRFRTLPDGRVEIETVGIPVFTPNQTEYKYLKQTWKNWKRLIRRHARKTGLLPSQVLAIATKETGLWSDDKKKQAQMGSPAGAQGIMQIMPCTVFQYGPWKDLVCGRDRKKPNASINMGSVMLRSHMKLYGGLPAAASAYNSGSLKCYTGPTSNPGVKPNQFNWEHEHDYAHVATKYNNTAIAMGVNKPSLTPWILGGVGVAGGVIFLLSRRGK